MFDDVTASVLETLMSDEAESDTESETEEDLDIIILASQVDNVAGHTHQQRGASTILKFLVLFIRMYCRVLIIGKYILFQQ